MKRATAFVLSASLAVGLGAFAGCKKQAASIEGMDPAALQVFNTRCAGCHSINGTGGKRGPDFATIGVTDKEWLKKFIRDPKSMKPGSRMIGQNLDDEKLDAVVDMIVKLNTK